MLRHTAPSIASSLTQLFITVHLSLKSGVIPSNLKNPGLFQYPKLSSHLITVNCQQSTGATCLFICHGTSSVPSPTSCLSMGLSIFKGFKPFICAV